MSDRRQMLSVETDQGLIHQSVEKYCYQNKYMTEKQSEE